jgi:hypothetical protein
MTRQDIVNAIQSRFATINQQMNPDYLTAIGLNVSVWRAAPVQENILPCVDIRDLANEVDSEGLSGSSNVHTHVLTVEATIYSAAADNDVEVRKGIRDIYKAIGLDDTWGGAAITTRLVRDLMQTDQEDRKIVAASVTFEVLYRTRKYEDSL